MKRIICLMLISVILISNLFILTVCDDDYDKDRKCAWCNGTGYNGNGATNVQEYVFKKTPCKHCKGRGTI